MRKFVGDMAASRIFVFALTVLWLGMIGATVSRAADVPSPEKWTKVKEVSEEYDYVKQQRCSCGGSLKVKSQGTGVKDEKNYDALQCECAECGKTTTFYFDVTSIFEQYKLAADEKAQQAAVERLNNLWPPKKEVPLEELKKLFQDDNPHVCNWAARRLAETPGGAEIILEGYLKMSLMQRPQMDEVIKKCGPALVASIAKRLEADREENEHWELYNLLGDLRVPEARQLLESQLREILPKPSKLRRMCYISLGEHGDKASEAILLEAFDSDTDPPDDALLWALGRCGTEKSFPAIRKYFAPPPKNGWSDRDHETAALAAIAAEGLVGDREAIPKLIEIARMQPEPPAKGADAKTEEENEEQASKQKEIKDNFHRARHNAIYALGKLAAVEAVPMMIEHLCVEPVYEYHTFPTGIYGEEGIRAITASHVSDAIHALTPILKRNPSEELKKQILGEYRKIMENDRYYLDFEEVANAAAELGWRELLPEILARLEKEYEDNLKLFGKDREEFSPSLRILTGEKFGEDPKPWREWLEKHPGK